MNNVLHDRGKALAQHLSSSVEFGLFVDNRAMLDNIARHWLQEPDVTRIVINNAASETVVDVSNEKSNSNAIEEENILVFKKTVIESVLEASDVDMPMIGGSGDSRRPKIVGSVHVEISMESTRQRERTVLLNSLLIMFSGMLMSAIFALRIGGTVANPIIKLTRAVKNLQKGVFDIRVEGHYGGELGTLAAGFNEMAQTLQDSQVGLQSEVATATSELRTIVSELEEKNSELDEARRQAVSAGQAKLEFLAKMSHEIRTPVNAVIGFTRLLEQSKDEEERKEYIRMARQASKQLLSIIDDILNISKIEYGTLVLEDKPFNLRGLVEDVVLMHSRTAYEKGLELVLDIHSAVELGVFGDSTRVSQVLSNLISNAIKFTEEGTVSVRVEDVEQSENERIFRFSVTDTGIGISQIEQERLFKTFAQVDTSITRRFGGTGLGLAIAKRLVEQMNGEIGIESEKGKGASFWFTLPLQRQAQNIKDLMGDFVRDKRVLIIEENPISRRALRNIFVRARAEVFAFGGLDAASTVLTSSQALDLIIMAFSYNKTNEDYVNQEVSELRQSYVGPTLLLFGRDDIDVGKVISKDKLIDVISKPARTAVMVSSILQLFGAGHHPVSSFEENPESLASRRGVFKGKRILVAEDNSFNKLLICKLLNQMGIQTLESTNGREAIESFLQNDVDMILMDIHMPLMDGLEATRQIRSLGGSGASIPIIALTADVFIKDRKNLKFAGLDGYLLKPISEAKLLDVLDSWLLHNERKESAQEHKSEQTAIPVGDIVKVPPELQDRLAQELRSNLEEIAQLLKLEDSEKAFESAHRLLGSIGYFGLAELLQQARDLETSIKSQEFKLAAENFEELKSGIEAFLKN
ncbi:MAG: ATP-binding protein [Gammaproteobacteria bacterium]|nr:ATP-binding protein [Gammaproteobacteria bacterium]